MEDITTTHLEAAIIDQKAAGAFAGKRYAFCSVVGEDGWQLGIAVANEDGYTPVLGKTFPWDQEDECRRWALSLNRHIGLSLSAEAAIIASTMGGRRVPEGMPWCERCECWHMDGARHIHEPVADWAKRTGRA